VQDQHEAATEALLPGLWALHARNLPQTGHSCSTAVRRDQGRGEASAHARGVTAIYGGLLKQPDKQKATRQDLCPRAPFRVNFQVATTREQTLYKRLCEDRATEIVEDLTSVDLPPFFGGNEPDARGVRTPERAQQAA
jgi:hypothetical protein